MSDEMESPKMDDKKWKCDALMSDIRRVEAAKANEPELYNEAVMKLKGEAKAISSIEELKVKGKKMAEKEAGYDDGDE